jgi:3-oxoacyl-[acyl-carrier protein] reductase
VSGSGRFVVVTGTSSGLGADTARRLLSAGYRVLGIARRAVDAADMGEGYAHLEYDFADTEGIKGLTERVVAEHGWPFGLVNSAASGADGVLPTMHNSEIERTIAVNLTAPVLLTKYLTRGMLDARAGRVVNITSIVASTGYRGLSVYAATKAGLEGFTRSLARDLGRRNITVNCIAPGFMETEMTARMDETALASVIRRSPLGRLPSTGSVAAMVAHLLGPDGDDITGSVITIDAGNTA